jgi:hypothetical protein
MSPSPKLKIKLPCGDPSEYLIDLEQAKQYLNFSEGVFSIEGQGIQSYDQLVQIASQDKYRNKEFLVVELLQIIGGG